MFALVGKACAFALLPFLRAFSLAIAGLGIAAVGVDYRLIAAGVALARAHHYRSGILKHRHEIWHHKALGIEVFHRLEDACTLPLPAIEFRLEIPAMALPQGYDIAVESALIGEFRLHTGDKPLLVLALHIAAKQRHIGINFVAVDGQSHFIARILLGESLGNLCREAVDAIVSEWHIGVGFIEVNGHTALRIIGCEAVHLHLAYYHRLGHGCLHYVLHVHSRECRQLSCHDACRE